MDLARRLGGSAYSPIMALNNDLRCVATGSSNYGTEQDNSWQSGVCPWCGPASLLMVAYASGGGVRYFRCATCRRGLVLNDGVMSPPPLPLAPVEGCPPDVEGAWREATAALSVNATTAAVMMCRKLLFHIAVEKNLPEQDENGRAPTFAACLQHLRDVGLLTPPLEPWIDHIREVGNEANHDLDPISPERAERVAIFTRQLLVTTYEMPHKMKSVLGDPDPVPANGGIAL